jgi:hypothetical protein
MAVKIEYPYVDKSGKEQFLKIKYYSNIGITIVREQTGDEAKEFVDDFPSQYNYYEKVIEEVKK